MLITSPTETADNSVYENVRRLAETTDTNTEIDANPLYQNAELYIIGRLPAAENRGYTNRSKVLIALGFIASSYMLSGDAPSEVGSETIKSETLGQLRTEYSIHVTGESNPSNRADFLLKSGISIIDGLVGTETTDAGSVVFEVLS